MPGRMTATGIGSVRLCLLVVGSFSLAFLRTVSSSEPPREEMGTPAMAQVTVKWLGVRVCDRKLIVQEVVAGTPAATAGIAPGERIYSVNGESNVSDIRDDLNEIGSGRPVEVVVGRAGSTRKLPIVIGVRPDPDLKRDEAIYIAETTTAEVEPGSPDADVDCRERCTTVVPECEPVLIQSQGADWLDTKWRDKLVRFDGYFFGRVFTDQTLCKKELQERCSFFF